MNKKAVIQIIVGSLLLLVWFVGFHQEMHGPLGEELPYKEQIMRSTVSPVLLSLFLAIWATLNATYAVITKSRQSETILVAMLAWGVHVEMFWCVQKLSNGF